MPRKPVENRAAHHVGKTVPFSQDCTLHYFRTTVHRLHAEVVQYNYPPFPPPRGLLFRPGKGGKGGGGGDTAVT